MCTLPMSIRKPIILTSLAAASLLTGCDTGASYSLYNAAQHQEKLAAQLKDAQNVLPEVISVEDIFFAGPGPGIGAPAQAFPALFSFVGEYVEQFAASLGQTGVATPPRKFNGLTVYIRVEGDVAPNDSNSTVECSYLDLSGHEDGLIQADEFLGQPSMKDFCNRTLWIE